MIQAIVSNANAPEYGQATISFPIREEDYANKEDLVNSILASRSGRGIYNTKREGMR